MNVWVSSSLDLYEPDEPHAYADTFTVTAAHEPNKRLTYHRLTPAIFASLAVLMRRCTEAAESGDFPRDEWHALQQKWVDIKSLVTKSFTPEELAAAILNPLRLPAAEWANLPFGEGDPMKPKNRNKQTS
jgi:hypothetical protein